MYENKRSPFDPEWYNQAFDNTISVDDQRMNTDKIIREGYNIPDPDGSRSSAFRKDAVLNNSFDEKCLRESLKDIYFNNSNRLMAANHDNTHFFQWIGHMSDFSITENTGTAELKIPSETFITSKERDLYKLNQFYNVWIPVTDILKNWQTFKWHCMLFINQKIHSEYELRIDDHEVTIRFKLNPYWLRQDFPVYIYKFDTNAQDRILVSQEMIINQWKWKMPVSYIDDQRVINNHNLIIAINKISDSNIRSDGVTSVDVCGDNLEFVTVEDGYIDLSHFSNFNKNYIRSESREYLWMTIVCPKFFNEFPILLPTDVVYQPYEARFAPVVIQKDGVMHNVKVEGKQAYTDLNGNLRKPNDGWRQIIRPVVLSDAFDSSNSNTIYDELDEELTHLKEATVKGADRVEEFRMYLLGDNRGDDSPYLNSIIESFEEINDRYVAFLKKRLIERDTKFDSCYHVAIDLINRIINDGVDDEFYKEDSANTENNFWFIISPVIYIPRDVIDKYEFIHIMSGMDRLKSLWLVGTNDTDKIRYRRPIDIRDFWTFEYYQDEQVWRPYPLQITHHFPDVYTLKDTSEETASPNRIFKTFFFYSDTINVTDEEGDIERSSASWDDDMELYHYDQRGVYRDIFMEKFYWMGIRAIYKGLLLTKCRWEVLEYVLDNPSYQRFNELFLNTMDPYFKLGLATYMKSSNFQFPFDDAIAKLQENINTEFIGYKRVTSFETYLNNQWVPSYFDYITEIMSNWKWDKKLMRRPRNTFDIGRVLPIMKSLQTDIHRVAQNVYDDATRLVNELHEVPYGLDVKEIEKIGDLSTSMYKTIDDLLEFTNELDLAIYSIDDINHIRDLISKHLKGLETAETTFSSIYSDVTNHNSVDLKKTSIRNAMDDINTLPDSIKAVMKSSNGIALSDFTDAINQLRTYFRYPKDNENDVSIIGDINDFDYAWTSTVKEARNKLFVSSSKIIGTFDPTHSYSTEEIDAFCNELTNVESSINTLKNVIIEYFDEMSLDHDDQLLDKFDYGMSIIETIKSQLRTYLADYNDFIKHLDSISDDIANIVMYDNGSEPDMRMHLAVSDELMNLRVALSYFAGENKAEVARTSLDNAKRLLVEWISIISKEEDIFNRLIKLSKPPIEFLETLKTHNELLNAVSQYFDTVNTEYIQNDAEPTYSDLYEVEEISVISGGFSNSVGESMYIPGIGRYTITSVDEEHVNAVKDVEKTDDRSLSFSPMMFNKIYDTSTSGSGIGTTVKVEKYKTIPIINDHVVDMIIKKIAGLVDQISTNIQSANNSDNPDLQIIIESISKCKDEWGDIVNKYHTHMTDNGINSMNGLIDSAMSLIPSIEEFIRKRNLVGVKGLLADINAYISQSAKEISPDHPDYQTFTYYKDNVLSAYSSLKEYCGYGRVWTDGSKLKKILRSIKSPLRTYAEMVQKYSTHTYEDIEKKIDDMIVSVDNLTADVTSIGYICKDVSGLVTSIPSALTQEKWYQLRTIRPANDGNGYVVGDIVKIVPQLPTDKNGEPITDMQDTIMNDSIYVQITEVDDGHVTKVQPLIDYATPYLIWGIRDTVTCSGSGHGLSVDAYSYEIKASDITYLNGDSALSKPVNWFDENDMFKFKFENIHDLDIQYEVFIGGTQKTDFVKRHETSDDPLHPSSYDVIYLNANEVMNLKDSSIFIPAENYLIYRINNVLICDAGSGYSEGQEIFVDVGQALLRLKIAKLVSSPMKGIAEISLDASSSQKFNGTNPASNNASAIDDTLNNIDDEYHNSHYDRLPKEGITKPATHSFSAKEYPFISKRFDDNESGDRNSTFTYPDVDMPEGDHVATNGDPDEHWYLGAHDGSDNEYNRIMKLVPPTDPFIPDDIIYPTNQDPRSDFQFIQRQRIHSSRDEIDDDVRRKSIDSILNSKMVIGDLIVNDFVDLPRHTVDWPLAKVGKTVIVEHDSTCGGHRMAYRIRTFVVSGYFVYDLPEVADLEWHTFDVDWMKDDSYPDIPSQKAQYPDAPWNEAKSYDAVQREITDGKYDQVNKPRIIHEGTYIHELTVDDLSVFNYTTREWEDLHDETRWKLEVHYDDSKGVYGFKLMFLSDIRYGAVLMRELTGSEVRYIWEHRGAGYDPNTSEIPMETIKPIWDNHGIEYVDPEDGEIKMALIRTIWETNGEGYVEPVEEWWSAEPIEDGSEVRNVYSYDMALFLNKNASNQMRNAILPRNATFNVSTSIIGEVNTPAINTTVNTGRTLRIRKIFPYEQKESYTLGKDDDGTPLGYEMNFKLANYNYYKNEIHLEDVQVFNKTTGLYEDIFNPNLYEVRFKDPRETNSGFETNTEIVRSMISVAGNGFNNGNAWAYNEEYGTHIFGRVTADHLSDGHLLTFTPYHFVNPPAESISLEFDVYQYETQAREQRGIVVVDFKTEKREIWGDGYIHKVNNRLAPLPEEFKLIVQYDISGKYDYEVSIKKSPRNWTFIEPEWRMCPTFHIPERIPEDRLYIITENGRFPLVNPSTGRPSIRAIETESGTDVTFLNLYRRYERLQIRSLPYPIRSVYTQRRIPAEGYLDVAGKINKPLNKKYFEFWVNGKLLDKQVTIISPTKIFLHGLTSLRNLEIIEINRDPSEYFADEFLKVSQTKLGRPYPRWDYQTYLDDALEGNLKGDNYTEEEQEYLLSPVWKQVEESHPEFRNYPPNVDTDSDILLRTNPEDYPLNELSDASYQFLVVEQPTIEGYPIVDQSMTFKHLGFKPMDESMLIDMMNEEWEDEIKNNPYFPTHNVISDTEWYGIITRMYDENGQLVHNIDEAMYFITEPHVLRIDTANKLTRIMTSTVEYDLS